MFGFVFGLFFYLVLFLFIIGGKLVIEVLIEKLKDLIGGYVIVNLDFKFLVN